ncbi:MAG: SUMF1/EgtB/PvdO family nonheme iron enzyme [Blastocatellia bacterium]|nr:SUMF1/EgtB/PvdO family nonheme iron enzyme [Blastocatellia bacterium]
MPFQPDDLTDLAEELRRAGYNIGTQQYVAAHDLLIALAAHGRAPADPREWRSLFAPIFCSTPAEQEAFPERFARWLERRGMAPAIAPEPVRRSAKSRGGSLRSRPRLLAAVAVLAAIAGAVYLFGQAEYTLAGRITGGAARTPLPEAKVFFDNAPQPLPINDKGEFRVAYRARRLDVLRGVEKRSLRVEHPGYATPRPRVIEDHPPQFLEITLTQQQGGSPEQRDKVGTGPGGAVPDGAAPAATPAVESRAAWRESRWVRVALAALPLILCLLWWLRERRRRRLVLEKLQAAGNPRMEKIVVRGATERLFQSAAFRRTIAELRRHRALRARDLDVTATVRATIRQAGLFAPQYKMRKALPEYLLLIDRAGANDEQARLADEIYRRLTDGGVFVERYYFQGDPRLCRRFEPQPAALSLAELAARHPDHFLLLFSDGAELLNSLTGEPERWLDSFEHWPHRALLTPEPRRHWGYREAALAERDLLVLSASEEGLASLLESVQPAPSAKPAAPDRFPALIAERPRRWIERQTPRPEAQDRLLAQLREYLDPPSRRWLAACAVYPAISWDLTLYLGERLLGRRDDFEARLLALVRLPWFRYGTMPDWLRERLFDSLDDADEKRVRELIEEMLFSAADPPKDGVELEFARGPAKRRLRDLVRAGRERGPLRDHVFLRFMSGRKVRKLGFDLPMRLRRIFYPNGEPWLGFRPLVALLLAVAVSAAIWFATAPGGGLPPLFRGDLRSFEYVTVTLDEYGKEVSRRTLRGEEFVQDLGNGVTIEMVQIPEGEFEMGSTDAEVEAAWVDRRRYDELYKQEAKKEWYTAETPRHRVRIAQFFMAKFEVTQRQWRAVAALPKVKIDLNADPSKFKGEDLPVEQVSWEEAKEFIARLNVRLGLNETNGYRLPSEPEWEYAARTGGNALFGFGANINPDIVNYAGVAPYGKAAEGAYRNGTIPVGSLGVANAWGLFDLHGNVWEWCEDQYHDSYNGAPADGRAWVDLNDAGSSRVFRGGGWNGIAVFCRSADRYFADPGLRVDDLGLRLVRIGRIP